jgi:Tfp pilus assembly protein PilF
VAQDTLLARQLSQQGLDALHQGHFEQAEQKFQQAIRHCPTNTTARYQLANCLWKRGAELDAIDQLTEALEQMGRTDVEMLVELGYMQANIRNLAQARQLSDEALRLAPDYAGAWQLQGDVLREQRLQSEALAAYHRCLSIAPDNVAARLAAAEIYQQQGQPARALAGLNRLEEQVPAQHQPDRMIVLKSQALRQLKRNEEAVDLLARVAARDDASPQILAELAQAQVDAGRWAEADRTIQRAIPLAGPSDRTMWRGLQARLASQMDQPDTGRR